MATLNENSLTAILTNRIFKLGVLMPVDALSLATAFIAHSDELRYIPTALCNMTINDTPPSESVVDNCIPILQDAGIITDEGDLSLDMIDLLQSEKSYPRPASVDISAPGERNRHYGHKGGLVVKAIEVLEKTLFTVDEGMLRIAQKVSPIHTNPERYVLQGCEYLVDAGNRPVHAEFFADARARLYQGDFHGPNGQSSDMARAFMELHGVSKKYSIKKAVKAIKEEMGDMVSIPTAEAYDKLVEVKNIPAFVDMCLYANMHEDDRPDGVEIFEGVKKPWSFVKAALLVRELKRGHRPYIGMAFGLDAVGSGPQLGALLTGDKTIAEATGWTLTKAERDNYELAVLEAEKLGIEGFDRNRMKKPYMAVYYGQAANAFTTVKPSDGYCDDFLQLLDAIPVHDTDVVAAEGDERLAKARMLHESIQNSFGRIQHLRNAIKAAHGKWEGGEYVQHTTGATNHKMPDGFVVSMKYWLKVDLNGDLTNHDVDPMDAIVEYDGRVIVHEKFTLNTDTPALGDYGRSGFVNMIQATDAYLARLIITKLDRLGAQHIIAVHDCFRVNINDFIEGKLHKAISYAYDDLLKGDILLEYFHGVKRAGGKFEKAISQKVKQANGRVVNKIQVMIDYKGLTRKLKNTILGLEGASYFSK